MVAPLVPPWLFNLAALAAPANLPHLQPGNHLRISHHPLLGLPDAPFLVWRAQADSMKGIAEREDVLWTDSRERPLTPPFDVTPDNPVTARLALGPGETCVWAEVLATAAGAGGDERPIPPLPFPFPRIPPPSFPRPPLPFPRPPSLPGGPGGTLPALRVEAYVTSPLGPAFSAARDKPRFAFAAPGIVELRISGRGTVVGLRWMEMAAAARLRFQPWRAVSLPHPGGARYLSLTNAVQAAEDRVQEAAPKRRPLQETLGTADPSAAPAHTPGDELERVRSLAKPLLEDLEALINDLSAPQTALSAKEDLLDEHARRIGEITVNRLGRVLQGALDPGVAQYLGYMTVDRDFVETEDRFVFYLVDAYFQRPEPLREVARTDPGAALLNALLSRVPARGHFAAAAGMVEHARADLGHLRIAELDEDSVRAFRERGPFLRLGALAVADRGAPPLPPKAPVIDSHRHVDWLPLTPPAARREVRLDVSGALIGGLLAAEKSAPPGAAPASMNATNADGYHLPLILSLELDESEEERDPAPGQGFLSDRSAPDATIRYSTAQQDRFGRWSPWARVNNAPGPRPTPPPPVLQAFYELPAIGDPMPAGEILVKVPVPRPDALAPGARLLANLQLETRDLTTSAIGSHVRPVPTPPSPPAELAFRIPAPALSATEVRKMRLRARWEDSAGVQSVFSEPVIVTMHDPRPPAQLPVPDTLLYSARPDVQGRALIEHAWTPQAGQSHFAVYYSDENRLQSFLESAAAEGDAAAAAALAALGAAADAAARAGVYRANAALFKSFLFERLEDVVSDAPGSRKRYQHYVSGSLKVLSFYRISAETETRARVPLETLPMIVYGVPNSEPPPKPVLAMRPGMDEVTGAYTAHATLRVISGITPAVRFCLRRSTLGAQEPRMMPLLAEEGLLGPTGEDGFQTGSLTDQGPLAIASEATLKPWVRYTWVAEAQGAPEPGSAVAGRWSAPSDPVTLALTPPSAPEPVTSAEAFGTEVAPGVFEGVEIEVHHPESMNGGDFGDYVLRVYRAQPGEAQASLGDTPLAGDGPFTVSGMVRGDPADQVSAEVRWRLVLLDPLGRASAPVEITGVTPR
jgi:hypothetical protein